MDTNMGKSMPCSMEAEQAILGSILVDSSCINLVIEKIDPEDFYFEKNKHTYLAMLDLSDGSTPVDVVTLIDGLSKSDKLENVGGGDYIISLATSIVTTTNLDYYVSILKEKSTLRKLILAAGKISQMSFDGSEDVDEIIGKTEQLIYNIREGKNIDSLVHIRRVLVEAYEYLEQLFKEKGKLSGIPTGFTELDKITAGLHGSELVLIAARPAMGKTSFAMNIAEHVAIKEKIPVAVFNLEMSKNQIVNRIVCSQSLVEGDKLKTGNLTMKDFDDIVEKLREISVSPMYLDDTASITVSEIMAKCRRLKADRNSGLGLVVIDYIQLMQGSKSRGDNRQQEISEISRSLKIMAKELEIPVIALSQLSRGPEGRSDKRPMLSDLRDSGAIEQDADIVMFLYRDEYYNKEDDTNKGISECIIAKHRNGEVGTIKLGFDGRFTKFLNIDNTH